MQEYFNFSDLSLLTVELPDSLKNLRYSGRFSEEADEIDRLLSPHTSPSYDPIMTARLKLERFIAKGLSEDYGTSFESLLERFRKAHPSMKAENLYDIINSGHADYIIKSDGIYFEDSAFSNIRNCCSEYLKRLDDPGHIPGFEVNEEFEENMRVMRSEGKHTWYFKMRSWIMPDEDKTVPGEYVRCWLPFPAVTPEQDGIKLLAASHKAYISSSPIRTVFSEFRHHRGERFEITFEYRNTAEYVNPDPSAAVCGYPESAREYLCEVEPHIVFTPYLKKLAAYLVGNAENPLVRARRIYDYVTSHVKYSFMREYRFLDNIPMYAALNGRGDCGVQALLFITLCRIAGIPAKWQSGGTAHSNGGTGSHDWALFYVEPYGWMHCDPSYGGGALRSGHEDYRDWYFCNIDPFRFVACTEFQRQLDPEKRYMRLDPYDNQSGEIEYAGRVLNPSDVTWGREILELRREKE